MLTAKKTKITGEKMSKKRSDDHYVRRLRDAHRKQPTEANAVARSIDDFYADARIEAEVIDTRAEVVDETDECYFFDAVISSDAPVQRWHYCDGEFQKFDEILVHDSEKNIDLSRHEADQLQLLGNHWGDAEGKIESVRVENGKAHARIKMMKTGKSGEIANKWRNGIGTGLSIGYSAIVREVDSKAKTIMIKEWLLFEVSAVGIPADLNAGAGKRGLDDPPPDPDNDEDNETRDDTDPKPTPDDDPNNENGLDIRSGGGKGDPNGDNDATKGDVMPEAVKDKIDYAAGFKTIREAVANLEKASDIWANEENRNALREMQSEAEAAFEEGGNVELALGKFNGRALHHLHEVEGSGIKKVPDADPNEIREARHRNKSLGKVNFRDMVQKTDLDDVADYDNLNLDMVIACSRGDKWALDSKSGGILREYKEEATTQGLRNQTETPGEAFLVPPEMFAEYNLKHYLHSLPVEKRLEFTQRAMSITGDAGGKGGKLLQEDVFYHLFVDFLYAEANFNKLGATMMMNITNNILIPRQTGSVTAYSLSETAALQASDFTIGSFQMSPKRSAVKIPFSRQSTLQTPGNFMENLVADELMRSMMNHKQNLFLNGTGSNNQPTGIMNTSGLGLISHGTNGGAPTYYKRLEVIKELLEDETYVGTVRTLTTPAIWLKRMATPRFSNSDSRTIWNDGHMNSDSIVMSNLLTSNATKGTGTNLHHEVSGDWREFLIGEWGDMHIIVDPYSKKENSQIEIQLECFNDCAVRRTASFVASKDINTA